MPGTGCRGPAELPIPSVGSPRINKVDPPFLDGQSRHDDTHSAGTACRPKLLGIAARCSLYWRYRRRRWAKRRQCRRRPRRPPRRWTYCPLRTGRYRRRWNSRRRRGIHCLMPPAPLGRQSGRWARRTWCSVGMPPLRRLRTNVPCFHRMQPGIASTSPVRVPRCPLRRRCICKKRRTPTAILVPRAGATGRCTMGTSRTTRSGRSGDTAAGVSLASGVGSRMRGCKPATVG